MSETYTDYYRPLGISAEEGAMLHVTGNGGIRIVMRDEESESEPEVGNKQENRAVRRAEKPSMVVVAERQPVVQNLAILSHLFESISGKDKMAKIIKYSLDLLRLYVSKQRRAILAEERELLVRYAQLLSKWNILMLLRRPGVFMKLVLVTLSLQFERKSQAVCDVLYTFRQVLRFGSTPFLAVGLFSKVRDTYMQMKEVKSRGPSSVLEVVNRMWFNEATLTDLLYLYYGITDELMLLHRMGLWSHDGLHKVLARHEVLSWQYDILLSLKKDFVSLQALNARQLDLEIQFKVKQRAREISQKLGNGASLIQEQLFRDLQLEPSQELPTCTQLENIRREKRILYLDVMRLAFDLCANSTDVFNIRTPPGTYGWISLASGITGFAKLWLLAKKQLSERS